MCKKFQLSEAAGFFEHIRAGLVVLAFQPVVVADHDRKVIYHECLLRRVTDGGRGLAPCETEILALERLDLIERLDCSVLWAVIETLEKNPAIQLGCNISALSLRHAGWWQIVREYLIGNPDIAGRLTLEITETSAITQSGEAENLLLSLRLAGCRIAIDDMGAGFSTMDFLIRIRPDIVKIDRAFVTQSSRRAQSTPLLRHLIALCSALSPCVVAEGVESEEEWNAAQNAGAHGMQGYLIQRPTTLPHWLTTPVRVRDSFAPGHRSLSANHAD